MIRNLFGGSKCRTVDVCDIFGDNSGKALYRLDGNANDESGNYHGTETGVTYGGGVYERGVNMTTAQWIYHAGMALDLTNASLSIWVNVGTTMPTGNVITFTVANGTVELAIIISNTYNNVACICTGSNLFKASTTQTQIPNSSWHHIVLVKTGTTMSMYLNGATLTLVDHGGGTITAVAGIGLGCYSNGTTSGWSGNSDQARFFNRAITATEVATLYNECAPTSTVDNINPFEDGSLKALYQFNGDATDRTGIYNGTATNVTYGTGKFGQCAVFNGTNAKVDTTLKMENLSLTISGYVKFNSLVNEQGIIGSVSATNHRGITIWKENTTNKIVFVQSNGTTVVFYKSIYAAIVSTNIFFTVTWDGTTNAGGIKIYIDGILDSSFTSTYSLANIGLWTYPFSVGSESPLGLGWLNGTIDQLRIFNKALTPMEVASLYNETTPLEEPMHSLVDPFKDNSGKALYRLDGNALDESGNYNGTATSVTYGAGRFGRAGVFTTSNSRITSTAPIRAISMWINRYTASTNINARLFYTTSNHGAYLDANTNNILEQSAGTISKIKINNVLTNVITRDTLIHVYIELTVSTSGTLYIGNHSTDTFQIGGLIDQARVFSRPLTDAEITALYTEI